MCIYKPSNYCVIKLPSNTTFFYLKLCVSARTVKFYRSVLKVHSSTVVNKALKEINKQWRLCTSFVVEYKEWLFTLHTIFRRSKIFFIHHQFAPPKFNSYSQNTNSPQIIKNYVLLRQITYHVTGYIFNKRQATGSIQLISSFFNCIKIKLYNYTVQFYQY